MMLVAILSAPATAGAYELNLRIEPGLGLPLTEPQSRFYGLGGGGTLKAGFAPISWVDVHVSVHGFAFGANGSFDAASLLGIGGGARFRYRGAAIVSPWLDADALY